MEETALPLFLKDIENWRFCLYESPNNELYCDFTYSPVSYADLSMLLKLTEQETDKIKADRNHLFTMSEDVRNNYKIYLQRALNSKDFLLLDKNDLLDIYSHSMGNRKSQLIEFCEKNKVRAVESYVKEFNEIQEILYNKINKITANEVQLSTDEVEEFCNNYCTENYIWIRDSGIKALNRWLIWMCWHEGILKV